MECDVFILSHLQNTYTPFLHSLTFAVLSILFLPQQIRRKYINSLKSSRDFPQILQKHSEFRQLLLFDKNLDDAELEMVKGWMTGEWGEEEGEDGGYGGKGPEREDK